MVGGKNGYGIYSLNQVTSRWGTYEPYRDKTIKMACSPSEDSDQPGHSPSLLSETAEAQADLSLRWAHMPVCWFCYEAAHMS